MAKTITFIVWGPRNNKRRRKKKQRNDSDYRHPNKGENIINTTPTITKEKKKKKSKEYNEKWLLVICRLNACLNAFMFVSIVIILEFVHFTGVLSPGRIRFSPKTKHRNTIPSHQHVFRVRFWCESYRLFATSRICVTCTLRITIPLQVGINGFKTSTKTSIWWPLAVVIYEKFEFVRCVRCFIFIGYLGELFYVNYLHVWPHRLISSRLPALRTLFRAKRPFQLNLWVSI